MKLLKIIIAVYLLSFVVGCSSSLSGISWDVSLKKLEKDSTAQENSRYKRKKDLSKAKIHKRAREANVKSPEGYYVSFTNTSYHRRVRIVAEPHSWGVKHGFEGYLDPQTTIYVRLQAGDYYVYSVYDGKPGRYYKIIKVRADSKIFDGTQFVHEHAEYTH